MVHHTISHPVLAKSEQGFSQPLTQGRTSELLDSAFQTIIYSYRLAIAL